MKRYQTQGGARRNSRTICPCQPSLIQHQVSRYEYDLHAAFLKASVKLRSMAGPILIILILHDGAALPPMLLDILFTFNIAIAVMVLLISMNNTKALDFLSFPTIC